MALFKVLRGTASSIDRDNANKPPFVDGYAYFTPDDGRFYIDVQLDTAPPYYYDSGVVGGKNIYRIEIESKTWAELINTKSDIGHRHDVDYVNVTGDTMTGSLTVGAGAGGIASVDGITAGSSTSTGDVYNAVTTDSGTIQLVCGGSEGEWWANKKALQVYNGTAYKAIIEVNSANNATFTGNLTGNASTATSATKATQDGNGDTISSTYLKLSGGTMTGALTLNANPTTALGAATKQYVDDHNWDASDITSGTLPVSRGGTGQTSFTAGYLLVGNGTSGLNMILKTSANTASTVVERDASGNFSAGTITANLTGTSTNATNIYSSPSTSKAYVLGTTTASSANHATVYNASVYTKGSVLYGAAWNDFAEYRNGDYNPGKVMVENGDDTISISTKRLQPGAMICSDTFGFAIGDTDNCKCPVAVAGRVLAYPFEPREQYNFFIGQAVCSGPNGTVSIMTKDEVKEHPECVIGYVSAIPQYEIWGAGNIEVNGRIWIKVK